MFLSRTCIQKLGIKSIPRCGCEDKKSWWLPYRSGGCQLIKMEVRLRKTLNLNITLMQGADFNPIILVPGPTTPTDITGYTFEGQVKENTNPSTGAVATFSFVILNQTTNKGQVQWILSAEDIDDIVASVANSESPCRLTTPFLYDIYMIDTLNVRTRIIQGKALVSPKVTGDV